MKNIKILILAIILNWTCFVSCKKFVEIPTPTNQLTTSAVFADSSGANSALLGIYINMMQNLSLTIASGGITVYTGLSADELTTTTGNTSELEYFKNSILPTNSINSSLFWSFAYKIIYQSNASLEGINANNNISVSAKNQLIGELKFIRAFIYFNLVNLYGDVPLSMTSDYHANQLMPRTPVDSVYNQIIQDLKDAENLLSVKYPTQDRLRPNLYTIKSLLAKVYLYRGNYLQAESEANDVISSNVYSLEPNLTTVFKSTSNESIWKLSPVLPGYETWEGNNFIPLVSFFKPKYPITSSLLTSFESGDLRKTGWLKSNIVSGQTYYYPFKYRLRQDGNTSPLEQYVIFRLAEQYLIRAEARLQQNNISGAIADVNIIRSRASLIPLASNLSQSQVFSAIEQERKIEFFCEWGNRWFDLKRWNKADAELATIKGSSWQKSDTLFPVPQTEINNNPFLTQNPGF